MTVKNKRPPLLEAVIDRDIGRVQALVAEGADVNARDAGGWSGLHFAAQNNDVAAIKLLLGAGADVNAQDSHGNTPLFRAVFAFRGAPESICELKAAGGDETRNNNHGVSPRSLAESIANYDARGALDAAGGSVIR